MAPMAQLPPYTADQFPADFATSVVSALVTAIVSGPAVWYLSLRYLQQHYPHHEELASAAIVAGCMDGALLGLLAFVFTFAARIWRYERAERKRSDLLLRLGLDDIERGER
jgi:hypothetical protein